jgi:hypothetical protein
MSPAMLCLVTRNSLEHFSNTRAVLSCVQGGFFLRKKSLGILLSLYTNWKNALAGCGKTRRQTGFVKGHGFSRAAATLKVSGPQLQKHNFQGVRSSSQNNRRSFDSPPPS